MPKPQYNVKLTDTGSKNYNQPAFRPAPAPPKVNPLKNWWNSVVNNARQNAFNQVNNWETVAPNVPTFNTNPAAISTNSLWNTTTSAAPQFNRLNDPLYSITNPFGVPAYGVPQMPTAYGSNTRRGGSPPTTTATMPIFNSNRRGDRVYPTSPNTYNTVNNINRGLNSPIGKPSMQPKPNQNAVQQYSDTGGGSVGPEYMSLNTLVNLGYVDPYASDPYEIGGSPYQPIVYAPDPELPPPPPPFPPPPPPPGGSYDYFSRPSSPSYVGYGNSGYLSMPSSPNYTGYGNGYYSLPSSGDYGGGGGSGYYSMPQSPNYTGYGGNGYASMPQAPTYRGRGGRNQSSAPATAYYRGINSGGGYGGGYAGGQSQRGAWYGALLQWNI